MHTIRQWKEYAIEAIGEALAHVEPQPDETGEALYWRALEAVRKNSRTAYLALLLFWQDDYRVLAHNYVASEMRKSMPGWRIRKATLEERASSARAGVPWLSWHCHEEYLRVVA